MIKCLKLENWKTHHNSEINFTKGTNIFVGKIGAGKSSIVDAICYAFYGTYPALQTKKLTLQETIMFKPIKKDSSKVVLIFEYEDKNYKIEREIFVEKTNTAKLYQNDKLLVGPKQTDVNDKISEILGIDYNLFIKIVYSEQNEIDYFLKIAPGKRKEQFDSLFGINNLENIKINSRELSRLISFDKEKQVALNKQIIEQISNFNILEIESELQKLNAQKDEIEKQILEESQTKQKLETEYTTEKEKKQIFETKKTELTILESKLKEILLLIKEDFSVEEPIEKLNEKKNQIEQRLKEIEDQNKKYEILKKNLESQDLFYQEQLTTLEKEIKNTELQIMPVDFEKLQAEKKEVEEKANLLHQKILENQSKLNELKKGIEELKKGFLKCPVCDSQLNEEQVKEKLKEKQNQEIEAEKVIKDLEKAKIEINEKLENLKEQEVKVKNNQRFKEILEGLVEKQKTFSITKEQLAEKIKEVPEKQEIKKEQEELISLNLRIEQSKLKVKQKEIKEQQSTLQKAISELNYSEEKYLSVFTEYKNLETKTNYLKSQKENLSKQEQNIKANLLRYNKLKEEENKQKDLLERLERNTLDVSYFTKALENSQNQLRTVLVNNINQTLDLIWPKVYPYGDYVSARLKAESDYILEVQTKDNAWIRVEGLLSGGERTCAALSIRVAIALSLTKKLGLLILDEPTHNLDTKTIASISVILEKDLPELVDQIFIVTHDSKLLDAVNSSKFIIERDKENDGVSKIIEG